MSSELDLAKMIKPRLARMDDVLIFDLFERSVLKSNDRIYTAGGVVITPPSLNRADYFDISSPPDIPESFLDFMLRASEEFEARAGRFTHPDERSFFPVTAKPIVDQHYPETPLQKNRLNLNEQIKDAYLNALRNICDVDDDGHYGLTATCDIKCLNNLSRRVHFGEYVAEALFQADPSTFREVVLSRDVGVIRASLEDKEGDYRVLARVREAGSRYGLNPLIVEGFFKEKVLPFTREVAADYLSKRKIVENDRKS